jgi:uncharacterized RDD family membrane protein YckC
VTPDTDPARPQVATLASRLAARLLDGAVLLTALAPMRLILGRLGMDQAASVDSASRYTEGGDPALTHLFWTTAVLVVVGYEVILTATHGTTLGKRAMRLRVVRRLDGLTPGWGRSLIRWGIPTTGLLFCLVGELVVYASPLLDGSGFNRGWHDRMAGTVVIRE